MHTEGNDMGKPTGIPEHTSPVRDSENPGYETQDVGVGGIATFLAGLTGFVFIFFVFCFFMGKAINYALIKHDGEPDRWHAIQSNLGATPHGDKREDLTSSTIMQQRALSEMTKTFPTPRLETDDGNQDLADLHAREDLLLDNYSTSGDLAAGTIRIPIAQAMQLVLQRGLPAAPAASAPQTLMAGESKPLVTAPLTDGFARTGYELDTMRSRAQRLEYQHAEAKHE